MQSTLIYISEQQDNSFLTLYETRLGLNLLTPSTDILNDQLDMLIRWSSDEIAIMCNRHSFGKETVQETFREIVDSSSTNRRIFLAKYPNIQIDSVAENGTFLDEGIDFEVDDDSGRLVRINGRSWIEPVVVNYTGGYDLPNKAPDALKQAAMLLTRESYFATLRGDATVRQVSHKETRVAFFDPLRVAGGRGGGGGTGGGGTANPATPARKAIEMLIQSYTRFEV
jgi:hypothetical protein